MLTLEGCRARQERLLDRLEAGGLAAALITEPRDIYYLTGLLPESPHRYPSLLFLGPGLRSWLITGLEEGNGVVDELIPYPTSLLYTLNPDHIRRMCGRLGDAARRTPGLAAVGYQREALQHAVAAAFQDAASPRAMCPIDETLQELQLRKDPDEVECIRRSLRATLAGYTRAQQLIRPGISELEVLTQCQAAAQKYSRQPHFYSGDFQAGELGGPARDRPIEPGELYIIDAWSDVNGYWSDMARTWAVNGEPTDLQAGVYHHLAAILRSVPEMARPGRSTRELWREVDARIREHPHLADTGLAHHAGHGVGLRVHEGPDLNRDRGGVFEVGNVFTCEPGAYSAGLRGGIRLENIFHVTGRGVEVLSEYPLSPVPDPACALP